MTNTPPQPYDVDEDNPAYRLGVAKAIIEMLTTRDEFMNEHGREMAAKFLAEEHKR